jgi:demethylspheroidene O-methyltransferase
MTDLAHAQMPSKPAARGWFHRLVARPAFQNWAVRFALTRRFAVRDGARIFDLVQGFVQSQALFALVELKLLHMLAIGPHTVQQLAHAAGLPEESMAILMQAGAAMGLLKKRRDGRFALARKGAALTGVPGLEQMILHHRVLYRDLEDPVSFLRGQTQSELAAFWPYVFGADSQADPETTLRYSKLMAESQSMVAADTLDAVPLKTARRLMDVGGGSGVFLSEAAGRHPHLALDLLDLPDVIPEAARRIESLGVADRVKLHGGSFRSDPLPRGADVISLIRVLYDHQDDTVSALLDKVHDALPPGGRLLISEPMSGGSRPDSATDVYFAFYTRAMGTGRTRSASEIAQLCRKAGFSELRMPQPRRPYVTAVVTAVRAG